ncbi:heavy metal-associated isoprenylated plant protein 41-like isoform X2 [Populus nigra]|uniref:heavy metal-associated isoprenylated plant protein 41-like isoform X2 n=1 Tax=Populus nigra TaxID=3691 RepID=UPI002B277B77|nr:heavy metal-associated isoprenylated plant protein 41-like isoform X2 [Populus nigra]
MKQKIVMEVPMNSSKHRTKAMKIAAVADGVNSVAIEGTDKVVVIGEVDSVKLAHALKKKFGHVMIVSVKEEKKEEKKTEEKDVLYWPNNYFHHYPPPMVCGDIYSPSQPPTCSIL